MERYGTWLLSENLHPALTGQICSNGLFQVGVRHVPSTPDPSMCIQTLGPTVLTLVEVWLGRYHWKWIGHPGQKHFGIGPVGCAPSLVPGEIHAGHGRGECAADGDCWKRPVASGQEEDAGYGREGKVAEAPAWYEEGATPGGRQGEGASGKERQEWVAGGRRIVICLRDPPMGKGESRA